jgi:hypothetical protein
LILEKKILILALLLWAFAASGQVRLAWAGADSLEAPASIPDSAAVAAFLEKKIQ